MDEQNPIGIIAAFIIIAIGVIFAFFMIKLIFALGI